MKLIIRLLVVVSIVSCSSKKQSEAPISSFDNVDASVKQQLNGFLTDYFALNQMLIEDSLAGAKSAAAAFAETAKTFNVEKLAPEQLDYYLDQTSDLKSALKDLSESSDIEKARVQLATVSEAMYALVKAFHPQESTLYYQYCPMARDNQGATWLSSTKELENPYMGQMMLECGRTKETIN